MYNRNSGKTNGSYCGMFDDFSFTMAGESNTPLTISSIKPKNVSTIINNPPQLPTIVTAVYNDGTTTQVNVTWDEIDLIDYQHIQSFNVYGTVNDSIYKAQAIVAINLWT